MKDKTMQLMHFESEADAREFARTHLRDLEITIVHSPHRNNKPGADYFVDDAAYAFIRYWEKAVFTGLGAKA